MADKKVLQIPFDADGNQEHYPNERGRHKEFRENFKFFTTLTFSHFSTHGIVSRALQW